jgi:hypothetical protein
VLLQTLTAPQATVTAAVVGAIAGVTGGVVTTMAQRRLEAAKWPRGREDALAADLRTSVAALITHITAALHAICWLTWDLDYRPELLTRERLTAYDGDMHGLLPKLFGGLAAVAVVDGDTANELRDFVEKIVDIDYRIGVAALTLPAAPKEAHDALQEQYRRAAALEHEFPRQIVEISTRAVRRREAHLLARR